MSIEHTSASVAKNRLQGIVRQDRAETMRGAAGDDLATCLMMGIHRSAQIKASEDWTSALVAKHKPIASRIAGAGRAAWNRLAIWALNVIEQASYRGVERLEALAARMRDLRWDRIKQGAQQ